MSIKINTKKEWLGMPEFIQEKKTVFRVVSFNIGTRKIIVRFNNQEDVDAFSLHSNMMLSSGYNKFTLNNNESNYLSEVFKQKITNKTKSIWFPFKSHWGLGRKYWISESESNLRYPVYIVSKGRSANGLTTKALNNMGVDHYIVVESNEEDQYKKNTTAKILVLPNNYLDEYETCDLLGSSRSKGPGAARNFCIDHSKKLGFKRHWVMDDNIDAFHRLNHNEKYEVKTGATLKAAEDFVDRYTNVPVAGLNYYSFCKKTDPVPAFTINTRIYSCLLIDNNSGFNWRGRYNEDTDLSLRVLKAGYCTIQFNAFLCGKVTTQRMSGGNTKEFYSHEGTLPKSKMIADLHPDVASVVWKFNSWHHKVDYRPYKSNLLVKSSKEHKEGIFNYGMELKND